MLALNASLTKNTSQVQTIHSPISHETLAQELHPTPSFLSSPSAATLIPPIPNLLPTPIPIHKPQPRAIPVPRRRSAMHMRVLIRVPNRPAPAAEVLLGNADGSVVPAGVQIALFALAAGALAVVADEEEAADS